MRVGLNCIFLIPGETGGMETYARELIPRLHDHGVEPLVLVGRDAADVDFGAETRVLPVTASDRKQWVLGEQLLLPGTDVDVLHSLGSTAPLISRAKRVTTIHDVHFRTMPEAHFGVRAKVMGLLVPAAARRSDRVIAVSQTAGRELEQHLRIKALDVVPHGIAQPAAVTPEADLRRRLRIPDGPFALTAGGTRPHKNVKRLIEAMDGLDTPLVVTGYATPEDAQLQGVIRTGIVSRADLDGLYAAATVVVAPSLSEGFGFPVLEAMVLGTPVACSAGGALAEVGGDAALQFDPTSVEDMRSAIARLLGDEDERARRAEAGRQRAATFSWDRAARETAAVYERAR